MLTLSRFTYTRTVRWMSRQALSQNTYQRQVFRHFEIDEFLNALGMTSRLASNCGETNRPSELFVLKGLAQTTVHHLLLFKVAHSINQLKKVLEAVFLQLHV